MLDCFLKENKEQQKEFIGELIALHRKGVGGRVKLTENEQYPCLTRAFLAKLGIFKNEKKLENGDLKEHSEHIEKLTAEHKHYKLRCQEIEKKVNELLDVH